MATRSKKKRSGSKGVAVQGTFTFPNTHGGQRKGAGAKPVDKLRWVKRKGRDPRVKGCPILVTMKLKDKLPSMREKAGFHAVLRSLDAGKERFGFRVNHYSILRNHVHMIVEATDREALTRGMQGLSIRIAKALNRAWQRKGKVFADRFHDRVLRSPREVRNALAYVLKNALRHGCALGRRLVDVASSGQVFDGWKEAAARAERIPEDTYLPVVAARTWLLRSGWRTRGLISATTVPGPA